MLLISLDKEGTAFPPLGLLSIGSTLLENGIKTKIIDIEIDDDYEKEVIRNLDDCAFVGVSAMPYQIASGLNIAGLIRKHNANIPIVWGGCYPTINPTQIINDPLCDVVVIGEGEDICLDLWKSDFKVNSLKEINCICYKQDNAVKMNDNKINFDFNMDNLPFPRYELLKMERYISARGFSEYFPNIKTSFSINVGKGCPYSCSFCHNSNVNRKRQGRLSKSAVRIADEIEYVIKKYKVEFFELVDDNFYCDKNRIIEFLNEIERRDLHFKWSTNARADSFKENFLSVSLLKNMKRLGLSVICCGVESGSRKILHNVLKKDISFDSIYRAASYSYKSDLILRCNFMLGIPGENIIDLFKTMFLMKRISWHPKIKICPQWYRPIPGTELYLEAVRLGYKHASTLREWAYMRPHEKYFNSAIIKSYKIVGPILKFFIKIY